MLTELCSDAPYLDIIKITANEMDAFLQEKMGISLAETKRQAWTVSIIWSNMTVTICYGRLDFDWCHGLLPELGSQITNSYMKYRKRV